MSRTKLVYKVITCFLGLQKCEFLSIPYLEDKIYELELALPMNKYYSRKRTFGLSLHILYPLNPSLHLFFTFHRQDCPNTYTRMICLCLFPQHISETERKKRHLCCLSLTKTSLAPAESQQSNMGRFLSPCVERQRQQRVSCDSGCYNSVQFSSSACLLRSKYLSLGNADC